jgi:hypothetical protein
VTSPMSAGNPVEDAEVVQGVVDALAGFRTGAPDTMRGGPGDHRVSGSSMALVETAGGPASPGPSGTLQV